ncbi:alsin homolog isoform X1 [Anastrepha ludens]|uniref:alsin homolog isoform X1 n=1 Tax=Anastrepha ludens TaxID=28586 RepID=UPI0023B074ED|nr:alsin homolog isoform X1 [Anastrepha ludens]XP_053954376.1 alsin homolog isoform X1 [Anastrepha ludens]XP_053954377.1 alsin homolog isoform X1 [Anastrepha ludens]XP_053954378.1 alsin homolog isoform X1 [Anastrepha ludens]
MAQESTKEAFIIYREGVAQQLQWALAPALQREPAVRLCAVDQPNLLFILTADGALYMANKAMHAANTLNIQLHRTKITDVSYCRHMNQLFVVTAEGEVQMQYLKHTGSEALDMEPWQTLSFDPLELSEEGIFIERICCAARGVIFMTRSGELYVMGSCGEVFHAEVQPKHLRLIEEGKEILDIVAGDEFFVLLIQRSYPEQEDPLELWGSKVKQNQASTSTHFPSPGRVRCGNHPEIETAAEETVDKKLELNSNSSVRSYSSTKSSHTQQDDIDYNIKEILKQGYTLLHTQVCTFGAENGGLLGTGDHIKRNTVNYLQKLEALGVCSVAAGREHSVARTLDGRLFHWGLNTQFQLNNQNEITDISSPTELKLDKVQLEVSQRNILNACCGDFQTVLLNARGEIQLKEHQLSSFEQHLLTLNMRDATNRKTIPLLLTAATYTLQNRRNFQRQFHAYYIGLQQQLKQLLRYRHGIQMIELFQQKSTALVLRQLQHICQYYHKLLYLIACTLRSFEDFYRSDFTNPAELVFIQHYRECIELFAQYTKGYCDLYSVDGFTEASKLYNHLSSVPLLPGQRDHNVDLVRICQQPFQVFPHYLQFLEQLIKTRPEFTEHLFAWDGFARQQRIDLELAENTLEFWQRNERNSKIRHFRRKQRRVILTSTTVPLKLAHSTMSMSSTTFILFSDCFCQVGSQLYTYPLVTLWLKMENDTALRITTPERTFTLLARTNHDKKLWFDQIESAVKAALGRSSDGKLSSVRTTAHVFSRNHAMYAGVHAYGRWRNGVLHGKCYLEYPDGRVYFGQIRNGEIEGYGKMVMPSVGIYEGHFKSGKFHGHGTYELKENEVYEGHFRDGLFHGHGTQRSNSYTYVGEYQANAKCGYGILDDMLTGDKYMGMFADNKRVGAGICITMNGDYFEGLFANDELAGNGIAVLERDYYYEGELSVHGPNGKGTYYMPTGMADAEDSVINENDEIASRQMIGNVLSGHLGGTWQEVRIISGAMSMSKHFPKYPKSIGALVVDNSRKWRSLFENFEEEVLGSHTGNNNQKPDDSLNVTKTLWNRIAVYMRSERERERTLEQHDTAYQSSRSYFAKNISIGFSNSFDKLSLKSTNSLLTTAKSSILDLSSNLLDSRRSHSQETLYDADLNDFDNVWGTQSVPHYNNEDNNSISALFNTPPKNWLDDANTSSLRSSFDSIINLSESFNNNSSFTSQNDLEIMPSFGVTSLTEEDVSAIKDYLQQAFKDRYHPLHLLNQRIAYCFYTSYGCWKVKPTPILAKQAMREWESISKRAYRFVQKMFPALPDDYCVIENTREVVSHITLLYPIVLSEGIYSTLFVLYANKCSVKDEMYRQNLMYAEKLKDDELAACLRLESSFLPIVRHALYAEAIQTLKQLKEKYSPKAMLTVIESCIQKITDAHNAIASANSVILAADGMMPLTLFLVLRAAVPHLGAELALLDDLTGGTNFQFEMNGIAGYCYTTLKAAYEHITAVPLNKT